MEMNSQTAESDKMDPLHRKTEMLNSAWRRAVSAGIPRDGKPVYDLELDSLSGQDAHHTHKSGTPTSSAN